MPTAAGVLPEQQGFGVTRRRDGWWVVPLATFAVLFGFIVYSTWAAFQNAHYEFGNYLSPMYSPVLSGDSHHAWLGGKPSIWPAFLPWSPALLILWAPAGFRLTCYYYRGSYYKAFWASPMNCTVGKPWKTYRGENSLPLIVQNVHRYFLYLAVAFIGILAWDAWKGMWFTDPATGAEQFGIGVGTLVLTTSGTSTRWPKWRQWPPASSGSGSAIPTSPVDPNAGYPRLCSDSPAMTNKRRPLSPPAVRVKTRKVSRYEDIQPIPDTPENVARAIINTPPKRKKGQKKP